MSVSDEQCRYIADKLRYTANDTLGSLSLQKTLAAITKAEDGSWRGVMRRLADLIDRPMTRNLSKSPGFVCELCGIELPNDLGYAYCSGCGAEVMDE